MHSPSFPRHRVVKYGLASMITGDFSPVALAAGRMMSMAISSRTPFESLSKSAVTQRRSRIAFEYPNTGCVTPPVVSGDVCATPGAGIAKMSIAAAATTRRPSLPGFMSPPR
jgi:hypothetical protein